jgi:hypothetical protein
MDTVVYMLKAWTASAGSAVWLVAAILVFLVVALLWTGRRQY